MTDEQLRNPLAVIPPALRPRVILRFSDQRELLASGLLDGTDVAETLVLARMLGALKPENRGRLEIKGAMPPE